MKIDVIRGKVVKRVDAIHDYIQIEFEDGAMLNIYNRHILTGDAGKGLGALAGKVVTQATEQDRGITVHFGDSLSMQIGMATGDFSGPEAMLYRHKDQLIVWHFQGRNA